MPVYFVTGKLGSGKTLSMVGRMRDYAMRGRGVVTNVDLNLRVLCPKRPALMPIRLPDKPTIDDLLRLGAAHRTGREELNGCIVLDECGTWLNSRGWSDKGRTALIDWLLHSRKLGWDVFFIIQNASMMDKQIREALCEYHVTCRRLDRLRIPYLGKLLNTISFGRISGNLPKLHMGTVHYGMGPSAIVSDTWYYRATDLYGAYSSVQLIDAAGAAEGQAVHDLLALPVADAAPPPAASELVGMHSLTWYETDAEIAARQVVKCKPKRPEVAALMQRPPHERIAALRALTFA